MIDKEMMKLRISGGYQDIHLHEVAEMVEAVDNIVVWHPYPEEKPPVGTYLVCYIDGAGGEDMEFNDYSNGFKFDDDRIYAWSDCPKKYKRE